LTPLPGLVAAILVTVGQNVEVGAPLAVIEAMKMENTVPAPKSGIIKEVFVAVGQELSLGDALVRIE
jgi:3-methylcrotonyl-CoA carboxylase alpha subunit